MRVRHLSFLPVVLVLAGSVPAGAGQLKPDEARRFVAGKLFAYTCFEGTQGMGRIYPDGSVVGTLQPKGRPPRFVALPAGTIKVSSSSICASVKGMMFQPCFQVDQTSPQTFRGSVSGLGFAYCDFVRQNPRTRLTGSGGSAEGATGSAAPARPRPLNLRPTTISAPAAAPPVQSAVIKTTD
ncbi:hypothetical protein [Rhodoplanes roseus]|uniref:Uncharacterized protein n=1 Tax=Rhodoplanes roseus TaxID=29409 RepID=A0A327L8F1_9BRAD|nr:hypothetical protein [Rhodoplanes roseus]RAI45772.1 hypothetical protein CH341_02385 [Rhodoplanes roseus]